MVQSEEIQPGMPVVCSNEGQFAVVDHMQGSDSVKLKKDDHGHHHFIPLSWVTSTGDGKVKVDRPGEEAMRQWTTTS